MSLHLRTIVAATCFGFFGVVVAFRAAPTTFVGRLTERGNSIVDGALSRRHRKTSHSVFRQRQTVQLDLDLHKSEDGTDKVADLFAWVCRAFAGDARYNNLMLAMAAIFGNFPESSEPIQMVQEAREHLALSSGGGDNYNNKNTTHYEEAPQGERFSQEEREEASLGAMGAAQWLGQWKTRPHALLSVENMTGIEDWEGSLPRGCRRTLKRSTAQNFTVSARPILNNEPAPHSSLAHFRCVVEHEVRLLATKNNNNATSSDPQDVLEALSVAISRYVGTTQMTGQIQEYRDTTTNEIIGFSHEVQKGQTVRGQWFYVNDQASKQYVWFHSVRSLVERAIASDHIKVVDLGPSGSDSFSDLKAKYGFASVDDWPAVAKYKGPFWDYVNDQPAKNGLTY